MSNLILRLISKKKNLDGSGWLTIILSSFSLTLLLTQGAGHGVRQEPNHVGHEARPEANLVRGANTWHQQAKIRREAYQCGER